MRQCICLGDLAVNLISAVPYELIFRHIGYGDRLKGLNLLKMLKVLRIGKFITFLRLKAQAKLTLRLLQFFFTLIVICTLSLACGFY